MKIVNTLKRLFRGWRKRPNNPITETSFTIDTPMGKQKFALKGIGKGPYLTIVDEGSDIEVDKIKEAQKEAHEDHVEFYDKIADLLDAPSLKVVEDEEPEEDNLWQSGTIVTNTLTSSPYIKNVKWPNNP